MKRYYYLYSITCLVNCKIYIGVTADYYTRTCHHRYYLRVGKHENRFLQEEYDQFGESAFVYDIISEFDTRIEALRSEKYLTNCVLKLDKSLCYNLVGGGTGLGSSIGFKTHRPPVSNETKKRMSISRQGRVETEETKLKRKKSLSGGNCYNAKKVIDTATGKIYPSLKDTMADHNFKYPTLRQWVSGIRPNKSTFKWL